MENPKAKRTKIGRRALLKLAAGAGVASASGITFVRHAQAADTTLAIWTGFPELQPFYEAVAKAYSSAHPDVKFTVFSTSLRETEQKLTAAVPTGTGPDVYDIGTNISVNFIDIRLHRSEPGGCRRISESRCLEQVRGRFLHHRRQDLRAAADGRQPRVDVLQQDHVQGGRASPSRRRPSRS